MGQGAVATATGVFFNHHAAGHAIDGDGRAVRITQMQAVIRQHFDEARSYPADLAAVGLSGRLDPWGRAYQYYNIAGGTITYTFTFDEAVTGFTAGDITVTNGSKGSFSSIDADTYTLVVTPDADSSGDIGVTVASHVATGTSTGRGNALPIPVMAPTAPQRTKP